MQVDLDGPWTARLAASLAGARADGYGDFLGDDGKSGRPHSCCWVDEESDSQWEREVVDTDDDLEEEKDSGGGERGWDDGSSQVKLAGSKTLVLRGVRKDFFRKNQS